jgi:membrane protein YfhO
VCVAWVVLVGFALLVPALVHGASIGPYDILSQFGLTAHTSAVKDGLQADQIDQMIPWATLSWTQVHAGHLPLWNSYNVLGTPLAFNWQSATFSVPALISYLLPLSLVYTTQVLVTLIVAGTGAYVLCRVLGLGAIASAFGGVTFELAGPLFAWLGWPIASVLSWTGWILAGFILIQRGQHRARYVVLTGVALAAAVYAGQPDALSVLFLGIAVFVIVSIVTLTVRGHGSFRFVPPVIDSALAAVLGFFLSAPLALPGVQLLNGSVRALPGAGLFSQNALPASQAFYGFILSLVAFPNLFDFKYVGVAAVVLAVGAMLFYFKSDYVPALVGISLIGALMAFVNPVDVALNAFPGLHAVRFPRGIILLAFGTAILAGVGLQGLVRSARRGVLVGFGVLFAAAGVALTVVWLTGANRVVGFAVLDARSYWWVAGGILIGLFLVGVGIVDLRIRRGVASSNDGSSGGALRTPWSQGRRWGACLLLLFESVLLVVAGGWVWNAGSTGAETTSAVRQLQRIVGSSVVGLGTSDCFKSELGIIPNSNILFGIHEYAVYDPLLPSTYYSNWQGLTGLSGGFPSVSTFCPAFTSASLARRFGVSYVLEHRGATGPSGGIYVATIGKENLFKIPGAGFATVAPLVPGRSSPVRQADAVVPGVIHPDPGEWKVVTTARYAQDLRLRLTDVPGWQATIDGRPLTLRPYEGIMLQATVPAGHHVVTLRYWPNRFVAGLVLAAIGVLASIAALLSGPIRRHRRRTSD